MQLTSEQEKFMSHKRLNMEPAGLSAHKYKNKRSKGKRSALLREKVSMAASSSWSQTELLSRPGGISHQAQQKGRKSSQSSARGLGEEVWVDLTTKTRVERAEMHVTETKHRLLQKDEHLFTTLQTVASDTNNKFVLQK